MLEGQNIDLTTPDTGGDGTGGAVDSVNGRIGDVVINKTDVGLANVDNTSDANKPISTAAQSSLNLKQTVFTGICQEQYLTENDIIIDCVSATPSLTIATVKNGTAISDLNPICFYTDGNGVATKHTKSAPVSVNFTYTLGLWYFYFDSNGDLKASQTTWTDFSTIAAVWRIYLNDTLTGQARSVSEAMELHKNDVSWTDHQHMHSGGTIHVNGGDVVSNLPALSGTGVPTTPPNIDGRNTVISLTTIKNQDDNMPYVITNSTDAVTKFHQNLGHLTAGTLTSLNSALFKVRTNDVNGRLFFLPATRFPFPWDVTTNRPQYITAAGVRTLVSDNRWFVTYVYALQDPRNGEAIKVVPEITDFTSYVNAQASSWDNLNAVYPTIRDQEIRPLYKLIFYADNSGGGAYDVACKFSSLVRIDDLRKNKVGGVSNVSGNVSASSVQVTPVGSISSTNAQSALEELDTEKAGVGTANTFTQSQTFDVVPLGAGFTATGEALKAVKTDALGDIYERGFRVAEGFKAQTNQASVFCNGINAFLSVADNVNINFGTGTMSIITEQLFENGSTLRYKAFKYLSSKGYQVTHNSINKVVVTIGDGTNVWYVVSTNAITNGLFHKVGLSLGVDSASTFLMIDGIVDTTAVKAGTFPTLIKTNAEVLQLGSLTSSFHKNEHRNTQLYNRALTSAEMQEYMYSSVEYADVGANNTVLTTGTLTIGKRYEILSAGGTFTNVGAANNNVGTLFIATGTTPTAWSTGTLRQAGCTLDLSSDGITSTAHFDKSGNNLTATYTNAIPININSAFVNNQTGVEYDTGERLDGAIVWGKVINFGALPNGIEKLVAHGISGLTLSKVVECQAVAYGASDSFVLPFASVTAITSNINLKCNATNVIIGCGSDRTTYTCSRFIIKYLK